MPIRLLLAVAVLALSAVRADAQRAAPRNALYFEGFGNGFIWTVNYERNLLPNVGVRVGAGSVPNIDPGEDPDGYTFPMLVHFRRGSGPVQPELGVGVLMEYLDTSRIERVHDIEPIRISPALSLGARATLPGTPGVFRAGITPLFYDDGVQPWFGASVGVAF